MDVVWVYFFSDRFCEVNNISFGCGVVGLFGVVCYFYDGVYIDDGVIVVFYYWVDEVFGEVEDWF